MALSQPVKGYIGRPLPAPVDQPSSEQEVLGREMINGILLLFLRCNSMIALLADSAIHLSVSAGMAVSGPSAFL